MTSRQSRNLHRRDVLLGACAAMGVAGCNSRLVNLRNQSPESDDSVAFNEPESSSTLVRDMAAPSGLSPKQLESVALVLDLHNTGSTPPEGKHKEALVDEMQTHEAYSPGEILAKPSTSLVMLRAMLPPGCKKDDRIDVEVYLPRGSKTTSLRHGWLMLSRMREHLFLGPDMRTGHVSALAQGPVLVDAVFVEGDNAELEKVGRVLGGGQVLQTRHFGLVLRENHANPTTSALIATSVNRRFNHYDNGSATGVASPKTKQYIELALPARYKHNAGRYLRVVRSIAVGESPIMRVERLQALEKMLVDPAFTETAALRLEALGDETVPILRKGLASNQPTVRFASAEALAYLDVADAAPVLSEAARNERAWRWRALTGLSAMDHVAALDALSNLLSASSSESRYGAFVAMRVRNPRDVFVAGEFLNKSFHFHRLDCGGEPMIHFSTRRRAELVVMGGEQIMEPPAVLFAGKQIMLKGQPNGRVRVTRMAPNPDNDQAVVVEPEVSRIVRAITELGGGYAEVFEALRDAKRRGYLNSRLVVDATPQAGRVRKDSSEASADEGGALPDLFEDALSSPNRRAGGEMDEINPQAESQESPGFFTRMRHRMFGGGAVAESGQDPSEPRVE